MANSPQGLYLTPDVITPEEEQRIIAWLDTQPWSTALKRRTQHYGYEYNYSSKHVNPTTPMSGPILEIAQRFSKIMTPTQCIANEYYRDQGINPHTDADMFGPVIMGLSIGAPCNMIFTKGDDKFVAYLPSRSLLVLQDEARTTWKHSIPNTIHISTLEGSIVKDMSYRRISLTYRTVINS